MDHFLHLTNRHTGETLRLCRVRDDAGQVVLSIDGTLPPHADGPPAHVHPHQREEGIVTAGTLGARRGNETLVVHTGEPAVFPAGVVHSWWNAGEDLLEFSGRATPACDLDRFLQAIFAVVNAGPAGRPSLFYLAHVLWRHRHTQQPAVPPGWCRRSFFLSYCPWVACWASIAAQVGRVRPAPAAVRRNLIPLQADRAHGALQGLAVDPGPLTPRDAATPSPARAPSAPAAADRNRRSSTGR